MGAGSVPSRGDPRCRRLRFLPGPAAFLLRRGGHAVPRHVRGHGGRRGGHQRPHGADQGAGGDRPAARAADRGALLGEPRSGVHAEPGHDDRRGEGAGRGSVRWAGGHPPRRRGGAPRAAVRVRALLRGRTQGAGGGAMGPRARGDGGPRHRDARRSRGPVPSPRRREGTGRGHGPPARARREAPRDRPDAPPGDVREPGGPGPRTGAPGARGAPAASRGGGGEAAQHSPRGGLARPPHAARGDLGRRQQPRRRPTTGSTPPRSAS